MKWIEVTACKRYVSFSSPIFVHATIEELEQLEGMLKRIAERYEKNEYPQETEKETTNEYPATENLL